MIVLARLYIFPRRCQPGLLLWGDWSQPRAPGFDRAFIKQGYGHFVEQVGDEPTRILILFNSGVYQEISLTNWLGGNPKSVLTSNFGIGQEMLDRLPNKEMGILGRKGNSLVNCLRNDPIEAEHGCKPELSKILNPPKKRN